MSLRLHKARHRSGRLAASPLGQFPTLAWPCESVLLVSVFVPARPSCRRSSRRKQVAL